MGHQLAGAVFFEDVDHLVGDFLGDFVPFHALPFAFAALADAFQRIAQPVALIHRGRVDRAFLAAARIGIGDIGVDLRVFRQLLFPQHDPVFDKDIKSAVPNAVDAMG